MASKNRTYESARPFFGELDGNVVSDEDKDRLAAYKFYEDAYHNRPEAFQLTIRGEDEDATKIYLPSAKRIIESTTRFLALGFDFIVDPSSGASPEEQEVVQRYVKNLFARERVRSKFKSNKRYGLIRGDQLVHITADDTKLPGRRISVHELDPSAYFPIRDANNSDRILGCHIIEVIPDPADKEKEVVRRQTYRREVDANGTPTGPITSELTLWEVGAWDDRNLEAKDLKPKGTVKPVFQLPPQITSIPVYHMRNNPIPGHIFGVSQLAGVESDLNAINQSVTDEDLTLVMQGLGMYWTNAGAPRNADGSEAPWNLGPGQVIEVGDNQNFGRVTGVGSVAPYVEHMKYLDDSMMSGLGIPSVASGRVDVTVAESGISLMLQMSPIIAQNEEKEEEILAVTDNWLWDLTRAWMPAYEQIDFPTVEVAAIVKEAMPQNRDAAIQEILLLFTSGVVTLEQTQAKLSELGYQFSTDDPQRVIEEQAAMARARYGDPMDNRYGEELEEGVA